MDLQAHSAFSRRVLFRRGGALTAAVALPAWLAACGGGGTTSVGSGSGGSAANAKVPAASGTLDFLGFEGDDLPEIMGAWTKKAGLKMQPSYVSGESEIEAKVLGGGAQGVDMVSFTSPAAASLIREKVVTPLDLEKLPNLPSLWPFFETEGKDIVLDEEGNWVGVPFFWGSLGIAWDSSVVPKDGVKAWTDILVPQFTGKVAMLDVPELGLYPAVAALGLESDKLTEADLTRVREWLKPVLAQVKTFSTSFGDLISLLGSGEVAAVFPGFPFIAGAAAAQGNKNATVNIQLKPAVPVVVELYGIPPTADNSDASYAWINEVLTPKINAQIAELQGAATATPEAAKLINQATKALYPYGDLAHYFASSNVVRNPPRESSQYATAEQVSEMWAELKQEVAGE